MTSGMTSGLILLDKPKGLSSQQAIYALRKKLDLPKAIKIGHGGTLDPLATGMLVIALGSATKFLGYLLNANKTYGVTAKLGQVTTTLDAEGEICAEYPVPYLDTNQIEPVLQQFTGPIEQIPPMYSALKFQGRPLYHYARKGQDIIRPPRSVHIYSLKLEAIHKDKLSFVTQVSKGTYIRSLVHDIGQLLGCGAHVETLHRLQVDPFEARQMVALEQISEAHLLPLNIIFKHLPQIALEEPDIKKLKSGQKLNTSLNKSGESQIFALHERRDNQFVALINIDNQGQIKGEKWV